MEDKYKKSKGNAGLEGVQFQLDLLTVSLLNALRSRKDWKISSENQEAGKYDDLVLEMPGKNILLQAKFKQTKKITKDQLLSTNSKNADFSLPKYFLSYLEINPSFKEKTVIICTNTDIDVKGLEDTLSRHRVRSDSILHYEGAPCLFFTFNKNILPELKANAKIYLNKNLKDKGVDKAEITDENIKDFLKKLQIFSNYPGGEELHKIIERLLSRLDDCLYETTYHEIYRKVEDWFKQPRGEYLTEARAKAMFCEIKSDRYCKSLKDYKVFIERNDFNFTGSNRIVHINATGDCLLQTLKIFRTLQDDNRKTLYVNPHESLQVRRRMIEAFELCRYAFLIIIKNETLLMEMGEKLREILNKDRYKTLILVSETNELIRRIGLSDITHLDGSVTFDDLSRDSQMKVLRNKNVVFQGATVTLQQLLITETRDDYTKSLHAALLEKLVKKKTVNVGVRPSDLDEDTARCYVNRTFEREIDKYVGNTGNLFSEDNVFDEGEKVILISDSAGMGKSTILTKLSVVIKDRNPHLWVIRINLNRYTKVLRKFLGKNKGTMSVVELLNSRQDTKLSNNFEDFVFSMNEKVVLMLDGIDEISPDYTSLIFDLLAQCREASNFAKIFATTRPHMTQELKVILKAGSFKMLPFTRSNQIDFLTRYWLYSLGLDTSEDKCKRYAKTLIDKMSSWIKSYGYWENHFTAVPLQVRMLAEIFQENVWRKESTDWEGCKEYLNSDKTEPQLPEEFNIARLYEMFIEKKRDVFIVKGNPTGNTAANQALADQFDECLSYHRNLALKVVLRESERDLFSNCRRIDEDTKEFPLKIGIVQKSSDEFQFVHRTFAEYFVADCILRELRLQNENVEFQRLLIDEILRQSKFTVVRVFLDRFLQSVPHAFPPDIFKSYRSFTFKTDSNLPFKLAGEGCTATLQLILKSIDFKIIKGKEIDVRDWRVKIKFKKRNTLNDLQILVRRAGINIRDENGDTPLHHAVKGGQRDMTKFLIEQGADINIRNNRGGTALHLAASLGHLDVVKCLMELGADVNLRNSDGCTTQHLAPLRSELDDIQHFMKHDANVNVRGEGVSYLNEVNENIETLTARDESRDELNAVKYLLDRGLDIDEDSRGRTPLHLAAQFGKFSVAKYLTERGVDVNDRDGDGRSPLHFAALWGRLNIVRSLVERGADVNTRDNEEQTPLHLAAEEAHLDTVRYLVGHGADINVRDIDNCTALHFAAKRGKLDIVKYLVGCGVDINGKDCYGLSILHSAVEFASKRGELGVVEYLVSCGADVNVKDGDGSTVLHLAARRRNVDVFEYLVSCGGDVNVKDGRGSTVLHLVARRGNVDVFEYLVSCGGDVNVKDGRGRTVLHLAARRGNVDVVEYLVDSGVGVNVTDNRGRTALHFAIEEQKMKAVKYLIKCGADVSVRDTNTMKYLKRVGIHINAVGNDNYWGKLGKFFRK